MNKKRQVRKRISSLVLAVAVCTTTLSSEMLVSAATKTDEKDYAATDSEDRLITTNDGSNTKKWTIAWSDEFNANALDTSKWSSMVGTGAEYSGDGWGNGELEYYTDGKNIKMSQEDGNNCLQITANKLSDEEKTNYSGKSYTSGRLWTMDDSANPGGEKTTKYAKTYGRVEAKIKVSDGGTGLWPAFWMMPANDEYGTWAASGEIDIMEARGSNTNSVDGTIHYGSQWPNNKAIGGSLNKETSWAEEDPNFTTQDWHTYAVEWLPGEISWYVDDTLYYRINNWYSTSSGNATDYTFPAPFDQDFYIILNLAVGGTYDNNNLDTSWDKADMFVDYVRVYDLADAAGNPVEYDENVEKPAEPSDPNVVSGVINETNYVGTPLSETKKTTGYPDESDRSSWFVSELAGGQATPTMTDDEALRVNVTSGGSQNYSVQMIHNVPLTQGYHYVLAFDAKADKAKQITAKFGNVGGYPAYSNSYTIDLAGDWKHYVYEFDMTNKTDKDGRLEFNMGLATGNCYFKNMSVVCTGLIPEEQADDVKTPLANGNHIYNGTFDQGTGRTFYWHEQNGAKMSVDKAARELELTGNSAASGIYQVGLNLLQSDSYKLTLDAKAENSSKMKVLITDKAGKVTYKEDTIALGTTSEKKTVNFTMPEGVTDTDAKITFVNGTTAVTMDNVELVRTTNNNLDWSVVDCYPLYNGDFYNGEDGWNIWHENAGYETHSITADGLKVDTNIEENPDFWCVGVQSSTVECKAGLSYNIEIDLNGDVSKKVKIETPDGKQTDYDMVAGLNKLKIPFTPAEDCNGAISMYFGLETGEYHFTVQKVDVTLDESVTVPAGNARPASITSAGDVAATHNYTILHNNDEWAKHITAVYVDGVAYDATRVDASQSGKLIIAGETIPENGSYSIRITADGYQSTKTIFQRATDADGNVLVNGKFNNSLDGWSTYASSWNIANATFEQKKGEAAINIVSSEGNNWDVQFKQAPVTVEASDHYILSFDAYADVARPIQLEFTNLGNPLQTIYQIGKTKQKYYVVLSNVAATTNGTMEFMLGNVDGCLDKFALGEHSVYLDNISLRKATVNDVASIVAPIITSREASIVGNDATFSYTANAAWENSPLTVTIDGNVLPANYVTVDKSNRIITINHNAIVSGGTHTIGFQVENYSRVDVELSTMETPDENLFKGEWEVWKDDADKGSQTVDSNNISINFVETVNSEWNTAEFWSIQAKKAGITTLADKSYTVQFDAELNYQDDAVKVPRAIVIEVGKKGTDPEQKTIAITPGKNHYSYQITPGAYNKNYLQFMTGGSEFNVAPHTLLISDIQMTLDGAEGPVIVTGAALTTPANVKANKNENDAIVTWDTVENAASYIVYRAINGGFFIAVAEVTENRYTDAGLTAGNYAYKVIAAPATDSTDYRISELSEVSESVTATSQLETPVIGAATVNDNNVTVSWSTVAGAMTYELSRAEDGTEEYKVVANIAKTSFTEPDVPAGTWKYKVIAKGSEESGYLDSADSNTVTAEVIEKVVKVDAAVPVVTMLGKSAMYEVGDPANELSVSANVADGGSLTYQWYKNAQNNTTTGTVIPEATGTKYTPDTTMTGNYFYYCEVTNTNAAATGEKTSMATSAQVRIVVAVEELIADARVPYIAANPTGAVYSVGHTQAEALTLQARSVDGGTLTYQWYSNTEDSNSNGTLIDGAVSVNYTPNITTEGVVYYYCVVTNTNDGVKGNKTATATSKTAKIQVVSAEIITNAAAPVVTQSANVTYGYGTTAKALQINAKVTDGGVLSYQWYISATAATRGTAISGATTASYVPVINKLGTQYYYCVVTNTNNHINGVKTAQKASGIIGVTVVKGAGVITTASTVKKTYGAKSFTIKATGHGKLTYTSSNKKVATISSTGKVKIKGTGITTITIKAAGDENYNAGSKKVSLQVAPKKVSMKSAKSLASKSMVVTWKKNTKATGYQIQYSTSKKFKSAKTVTINKNKTLTKTIKKLKAGKKYYVRIRAYKKSGSKKVYSSWSKKKTVKIKK